VVGKWHLGLNWARKPGSVGRVPKPDEVDYARPVTGGPESLGFDYNFIFPCGLDFPPFCFVEQGMTVGNPSESIQAEAEKLPPRYREQYEGVAPPGWKNSEVGPTITRKAVRWLEAHHEEKPSQPFFLYLPTSAPHVPYAPPEFIKGKSHAGRRGDMCTEVDWTVGEVLRTLDRLGLADTTLVIFTSDNGGIIGDRKEGVEDLGPEELYETYGHHANGPFRGQKWTIYEGGFRVPFVVRWPGHVRPGRVSNQLICLADFVATCAAILGEKLPAGAGPDSHNILPELLGEKLAGPLRDNVVLHSQMGMFAIRQGPWKLIDGHGQGTWYADARPPLPGEPPGQLYNVEEDPGETRNLWREHPNVVNSLADWISGPLPRSRRPADATLKRQTGPVVTGVNAE
jgi:arylsulfatase A